MELLTFMIGLFIGLVLGFGFAIYLEMKEHESNRKR